MPDIFSLNQPVEYTDKRGRRMTGTIDFMKGKKFLFIQFDKINQVPSRVYAVFSLRKDGHYRIYGDISRKNRSRVLQYHNKEVDSLITIFEL